MMEDFLAVISRLVKLWAGLPEGQIQSLSDF